jgi:catechol 2,3-dioxygenase-like lactoylglutathione lyase family enzyme
MNEARSHQHDAFAATGVAPLAGVKGAVTFFYYDDVEGAAGFYERIIGLRNLMANEWCSLFELRPGAVLGLVNATAGSQAPIDGPNKGAIISLEVDDLDACLARMKALGAVPQAVALEPGCAGRTWEFKVRDPGGYIVEFFRWIDPIEFAPARP